jgi:hypothetical protein
MAAIYCSGKTQFSVTADLSRQEAVVPIDEFPVFILQGFAAAAENCATHEISWAECSVSRSVSSARTTARRRQWIHLVTSTIPGEMMAVGWRWLGFATSEDARMLRLSAGYGECKWARHGKQTATPIAVGATQASIDGTGSQRSCIATLQ